MDDTTNKRFAIIVDEAHSSQTGSSAMKLKAALADVSDALKEYAELEGKAEDELLDDNDRLVREMISHGKHKNLSFFAGTASTKYNPYKKAAPCSRHNCSRYFLYPSGCR